MQTGMEKADKINMNMVRALHLGYIGLARAAINEVDAALEIFEEAFVLVETTEERMFEAELYRMHSEVFLQMGSHVDAEEALSRALTIARDQQARMFELRAAIDLARLWIQQDKRREARDLLTHGFGLVHRRLRHRRFPGCEVDVG